MSNATNVSFNGDANGTSTASTQPIEKEGATTTATLQSSQVGGMTRVENIVPSDASLEAEADAKAAQRQALLERLGITESEAQLLLGGSN